MFLAEFAGDAQSDWRRIRTEGVFDGPLEVRQGRTAAQQITHGDLLGSNFHQRNGSYLE
jgi:hypothetical protein